MGSIETRADIEKMVNQFYAKVRQDELLAPLFANLDWPAHLPTMYDFWSSMILGDQTYKGSPFQKHVALAIDARHFERWLTLFNQTVDELFSGGTAQEVKDRAYSIASVWRHKLSQMKSGGV